MKKESEPFLIKKKDIVHQLGYSSMKMVYKKVLTKEIIKELGFKSLDEFKKIRVFNLHQSRIITEFLNDLLNVEKIKEGQ